jgi:hypothetical protein
MAAVRMHRYTVDPADLQELLARRATLIDALRAAHPGLAEARLTRLADGTYSDVWRWESAEQMRARPLAACPGWGPGWRGVVADRDRSAVDGEIVNER